MLRTLLATPIKPSFKKLAHVIPSACLLCGIENHQAICCDCSAQFFSSSAKRCVGCALPVLVHDTHCGACLKNPPAFNSTTVVCDYVAPLDQLVLALKFGHRLAIAHTLAELLTKTMLACADPHELPDFFIAVPLSRPRLAQRGFNQALEIARPLARRLNRPVHANLLHRVRDTKAQTRSHPNQRHENIRHAFSVDPAQAGKIAHCHIGVVDDVMTTGATLHEIAACLKKHGAARISNIVFARTPPRH